MTYQGCTLEYWGTCLSQANALKAYQARGGELYAYTNANDMAAVTLLVAGLRTSDVIASLQCIGAVALFPDLNTFAWTGIVSAGGNSTCGQRCTWTDINTGKPVANASTISAIKPCAMAGDGSAVEFVRWGAQGCPNGGSNDVSPGSTANYICKTNCSKCCSTRNGLVVLFTACSAGTEQH